MSQTLWKLTREKHLDHMVKVVPFIVMGYAIQCYIIMQMGVDAFATDALIFLGGCLGLMIAGFIFYDLKHQVEFSETHFVVTWLGRSVRVAYEDIESVSVSEEGQSFATVSLRCRGGRKCGFYFVDDADKMKKWLDEKRQKEILRAA